ncbi:uncharacterized protein [Maniola hyperantus]|uniref:uncharacterized protein n=1 Tax=Aphantopus hyperantus TaxID=2795564 RepID=UPI0015697350|nr:uncharacterized protein LOC117995657 [Maniola hyperantus]
MNNIDLAKLAKVPIAKPGFDTLAMSAPVLVQMNTDGKWESSKPCNLDEKRLKAIVQHLVNSNAVSAAQSYCGQCASENQKGGKSNYVPVIMMPIQPADQCPFDLECEVQKMKETEEKKPPKKISARAEEKDSSKGVTQKKIRKRQFVVQRLTDFDLLSQW